MPSSFMATAFLASDLEMPSAISRPVMPAGNARDGIVGKGQLDHHVSPAHSRVRARVSG